MIKLFENNVFSVEILDCSDRNGNDIVFIFSDEKNVEIFETPTSSNECGCLEYIGNINRDSNILKDIRNGKMDGYTLLYGGNFINRSKAAKLNIF